MIVLSLSISRLRKVRLSSGWSAPASRRIRAHSTASPGGRMSSVLTISMRSQICYQRIQILSKSGFWKQGHITIGAKFTLG